MKRTSFLLFLGGAAFLIVAVYSGYVFWQKSVNADSLKVVTKSITDYQNQVTEKENARIAQAINAKQTVNDLKKDLIQWSKVISDIRETIPSEDTSPILQILSYSGSSTKDISVNVKTFPDRESPYFDVAALIKSFNDSEVFVQAFVPAISSGTDEQGREILSFLLNAQYVPQKEVDFKSKKLEESVSDVLDSSLEVSPPDAEAPVGR